ncbi:hypothetical protein [Sphingomonas sp.]|uniref:hypothetical protein n=1 Tax=Sphingomonas sp. TaxID=28214 RepID=UPI002ED89EAF
MDGDIVRLESCTKCGGSIQGDASFCNHCGKRVKRAPSDGDPANLGEAAVEFAKGTAVEARNLGAEALRSDIGKKVAAGAALGAVAGAVLPLIGPAIGATLGAGYVAFKRLTK